MLKFIRRALRWILGGSFTMLIAACYGVGADFKGKDVKVKCNDTNQNPIPGLAVKLNDNLGSVSTNFSDTFGESGFYISENFEKVYSLTIEDTDGTNNSGDFRTYTLSNLTYSSVLSDYYITMTNK